MAQRAISSADRSTDAAINAARTTRPTQIKSGKMNLPPFASHHSMKEKAEAHASAFLLCGRLARQPESRSNTHWTSPHFMPHSRKVRRGTPYKDSGSIGRAPARRLYELQALAGLGDAADFLGQLQQRELALANLFGSCHLGSPGVTGRCGHHPSTEGPGARPETSVSGADCRGNTQLIHSGQSASPAIARKLSSPGAPRVAAFMIGLVP